MYTRSLYLVIFFSLLHCDVLHCIYMVLRIFVGVKSFYFLGTLPTVGPARQFFTRSPGLDNSVRVSTIDTLNRVILFFVIVIVAVVILGFLYLIYRYVNRSHVKYRRIRKSEKPKNGPTQGPSGQYKKLQSQPSFNPGAQSNPAPVVIQSSKPQQSQDDDNFFL